ncbi:AtpZ/AtpI family protein [Jannaschia sp. KMU-145]|uniref:AtpZ/AtpI family protein n=1 Tax=Jannaschia halovivens TaxID=3388667 RepID=UPI00396B1671
MSDDDADRLKALEAKLAAKRPPEEKDHMEEHYSQAQLAWRMVIELVAGLGIGFGIGYGLDALLGTQPWLMVVFTLLGFAAGVKTMISSAQEMQGKLSVSAALKEPGAGAPKDEGDHG